MSVICPFCNKDDTSTFSDTITKEFGFHCHKCKKDFGVFTSEKLNSIISNFKSMIGFEDFKSLINSLDKKEYLFSFNKVEGKILLKINTYINMINNDYEEIDFTSLFDNFISILLNQFFILDITSSEINKDKDFFIIEVESNTKIVKKTNFFNYYLDLLVKLMFQLIGSENEKN